MKTVDISLLPTALSGGSQSPRVIVSGNFATPRTLLAAFDEAVPSYTLHMLNGQPGIPDRDGVTYESAFVGAGMRNHPRLNYFPARLSLLPRLLKTHCRPDIVLIHTSLPRDGKVSLGTEVNVLPAAIESIRKHGGLVIAQANPQMPYTFGDSEISLEDIDYLIEVDEQLAEHSPHQPTDIAREIGTAIASHVKNGSTMQLGIGDIPDSVLTALLNHKNLRIWTEMFSDGVLRLRDAGALDTDSNLTASFVFGSRELYEWLHLNDKVTMQRTEVTNDSGHISQQPQMTSVNAALQVDLFDQANASRVRGNIYSGFGGSTDFIVGALHAKGGLAFMALPSWHAKSNTSTIVPLLKEPVTSFQHSFVVTEHGMAHCAGASQAQQARNLIEHAAHPDARDELMRAAHDLKLF